jgi:hypothetical protein
MLCERFDARSFAREARRKGVAIIADPAGKSNHRCPQGRSFAKFQLSDSNDQIKFQEETMYLRSVFASLLVASSSGHVLGQDSRSSQADKLATQGVGLLAEPIAMPERVDGKASKFFYKSDASSGLFSRSVYENAEDPNFGVIIRDISIPPDNQSHKFSLTNVALLTAQGDLPKLVVNGQQTMFAAGSSITVTAGDVIEATNSSKRAVAVRVIEIERRPQ